MSLKDVMNKVKATDVPPAATFDVGAAVWAYYASLNEAVDEAREEGYHPSQMYGFCPRQEILKHFFPKPSASIITPELQTAFDWEPRGTGFFRTGSSARWDTFGGSGGAVGAGRGAGIHSCLLHTWTACRG